MQPAEIHQQLVKTVNDTTERNVILVSRTGVAHIIFF